jgi:hypothetical protein
MVGHLSKYLFENPLGLVEIALLIKLAPSAELVHQTVISI